MLHKKSNRIPLAIVVLGIAFALAIPAHAQTEADCAARADRAARDSGRVVGGAAVGAAGGAAVGAIVGNNRKCVGHYDRRHNRGCGSKRGDVRRGAAIGTVVGGTAGAVRNNKTYKRVYDDCMAGR